MNNKVISTTSNLRFRNDPINAIISLGNEVSVWASTSSWRSYENYIGQRILYPAYTTDIRASILKSSRLHTAIQNIVEKANENDRQKLKHVLWKQALLIINNMIAELDSIATLRVFAFFVTNAITRMYHQGIHIQNNEFSKVKQVAEYAMKNQISMIYLPCHKSHMDYLVISYVFYRLGLSLPHIAAGDNLNMPFVGSILKHCGAFYIKRSWGDDPIYLAIVKEYIQVLLEKGIYKLTKAIISRHLLKVLDQEWENCFNLNSVL